jgi:2,3-bisphosphoglycerate-independent phosphoglycerate mutase
MQLLRQPLVLIILDGFGVAPPSRGNAIEEAVTPVFDKLLTNYPVMTLQAAGEAVGLPWGEMGNSEVGHMNIGAGKILFQDLPRITRAIGDGTFMKNPMFEQAAHHVAKSGGTLHLMGLISSGGVHSSLDHLLALIEFAQKAGVKKLAIHAILDGRDTPRDSGMKFLSKLQTQLDTVKLGVIASLSGRYYAMDRDNHWDRIELAYQAMTGVAEAPHATNAEEALKSSYAQNIFDEEFKPTTIVDSHGKAVAPIQDGDAVIFTNFRNDRARQLTKAFALPGFEKFERSYFGQLFFVTMTEYERDLPVYVAFPPEHVNEPLAKVIADLGLRQLHVAETEKYAHVTFFFNGGTETAFPGEERILVPSPSVASYDQKPEMAAAEITERAVKEITSNKFAFVVINFANPDMVGHTANIPATIKAVEVVDRCVGEIVEATLSVNGIVAITADHGNAEDKISSQTGALNKEHTANPVPFMIIGNDLPPKTQLYRSTTPDISSLRPMGVLSDVAPTLLGLIGVPKSAEMTGHDLFS